MSDRVDALAEHIATWVRMPVAPHNPAALVFAAIDEYGKDAPIVIWQSDRYIVTITWYPAQLHDPVLRGRFHDALVRLGLYPVVWSSGLEVHPSRSAYLADDATEEP